jgi:alpha-tubulin suppressor-like RCC1 family protein
MPYEPTTNFRDSDGVDLGKKLVTKDYLLSVYETILESSGATGLVVTPELWTWGTGSSGQLGINNTSNKLTPVTTFAGGINWKQVAGGSQYTAAIKTDGSLWTWGLNSSGQLGDNTTTNRSTPVTTFAGGNNWKSVACGGGHTLAIKTDGSLWVWGAGGDGRLGDFSTTTRSTPVTTFVGGNTWKSVAGGNRHSAAVKTDGTLWVWGLNENNQMGTNGGATRSTPTTTFVGGTTWKQVACGGFHTVAIKTDGTLWIWGNNVNNFGQIGVNDGNNRATPVTTFAGGNNWKSVTCGEFRTTAIKTDGSLWGWGSSFDGQLGTNDGINRSTPVTTFAGGNNWKSASSGVGDFAGHVAAIKTDGTLWTWGTGGSGRLGTNDGTNRSTPVTTFAGGNNWKQVSGGTSHTVAIQSNDYI